MKTNPIPTNSPPELQFESSADIGQPVSFIHADGSRELMSAFKAMLMTCQCALSGLACAVSNQEGDALLLELSDTGTLLADTAIAAAISEVYGFVVAQRNDSAQQERQRLSAPRDFPTSPTDGESESYPVSSDAERPEAASDEVQGNPGRRRNRGRR